VAFTSGDPGGLLKGGRSAGRVGRDPLTGALTRDRLREELARALAACERYGEPVAVCLIDLDRFRLVNEAHGHATGDRLLTAAATSLAARLRATDALGRVGADEFAVVLPRTDSAAATAVASDLLVAIRNGVHMRGSGENVRMTASVGVAFVGRGECGAATDLLARADIAVQSAKAAGRDRVAIAEDPGTGADRARASLSWAGRLREALESGGLALHAQPIVPLDANVVERRHELLVRLRDAPEIRSTELIATAETFGQIQAVDGWVCARALDILTSTRDAVVHVNLAAASIGDADLMAFVARAVRAANLAPGRLVFEITETSAIADFETATVALERLRALGCHTALDDFGSGFASFAYLKRLPFDFLKIDGEFVRELPFNVVDQLAVEAMAGIAKGLGLRTVAEYVSNDETMDLLRGLGIEYAQGFHVGQPVATEQVFS
jgi:diguanylate cyclase (GGDEF)-like protein